MMEYRYWISLLYILMGYSVCIFLLDILMGYPDGISLWDILMGYPARPDGVRPPLGRFLNPPEHVETDVSTF